MSITISVDREWLHCGDGPHELKLPVEWPFVARTKNCPIDFEVLADDLATRTKLAGEPIDPVRCEQVLGEIADYHSKAPAADIIGTDRAFLRGLSAFKFSHQIHPTPSPCHEAGRLVRLQSAATPSRVSSAVAVQTQRMGFRLLATL
jgi:hypothetical protein